MPLTSMRTITSIFIDRAKRPLATRRFLRTVSAIGVVFDAPPDNDIIHEENA